MSGVLVACAATAVVATTSAAASAAVGAASGCKRGRCCKGCARMGGCSRGRLLVRPRSWY